MECIIADGGSIIALCKVNQFKLIIKLFNQCMITQAVYDEVITGSDVAVSYIQQAVESNHVTVKPSETITSDLLKTLDNGEATSILLALENRESALLLDESKGLQIAQHLGIPLIGLAGLLLLAKKKTLIRAVMPLLIEIRDNGYWLSDKFLKSISELSDEEF